MHQARSGRRLFGWTQRLAAHGWQVTGVDFSANALAHARSTAEALRPDIAGRTSWIEGASGVDAVVIAQRLAQK